jgi:hypothetical protein
MAMKYYANGTSYLAYALRQRDLSKLLKAIALVETREDLIAFTSPVKWRFKNGRESSKTLEFTRSSTLVDIIFQRILKLAPSSTTKEYRDLDLELMHEVFMLYEKFNIELPFSASKLSSLLVSHATLEQLQLILDVYGRSTINQAFTELPEFEFQRMVSYITFDPSLRDASDFSFDYYKTFSALRSRIHKVARQSQTDSSNTYSQLLTSIRSSFDLRLLQHLVEDGLPINLVTKYDKSYAILSTSGIPAATDLTRRELALEYSAAVIRSLGVSAVLTQDSRSSERYATLLLELISAKRLTFSAEDVVVLEQSAVSDAHPLVMHFAAQKQLENLDTLTLPELSTLLNLAISSKDLELFKKLLAAGASLTTNAHSKSKISDTTTMSPVHLLVITPGEFLSLALEHSPELSQLLDSSEILTFFDSTFKDPSLTTEDAQLVLQSLLRVTTLIPGYFSESAAADYLKLLDTVIHQYPSLTDSELQQLVSVFHFTNVETLSGPETNIDSLFTAFRYSSTYRLAADSNESDLDKKEAPLLRLFRALQSKDLWPTLRQVPRINKVIREHFWKALFASVDSESVFRQLRDADVFFDLFRDLQLFPGLSETFIEAFAPKLETFNSTLRSLGKTPVFFDYLHCSTRAFEDAQHLRDSGVCIQKHSTTGASVLFDYLFSTDDGNYFESLQKFATEFNLPLDAITSDAQSLISRAIDSRSFSTAASLCAVIPPSSSHAQAATQAIFASNRRYEVTTEELCALKTILSWILDSQIKLVPGLSKFYADPMFVSSGVLDACFEVVGPRVAEECQQILVSGTLPKFEDEVAARVYTALYLFQPELLHTPLATPFFKQIREIFNIHTFQAVDLHKSNIALDSQFRTLRMLLTIHEATGIPSELIFDLSPTGTTVDSSLKLLQNMTNSLEHLLGTFNDDDSTPLLAANREYLQRYLAFINATKIALPLNLNTLETAEFYKKTQKTSTTLSASI